MSKTVSAMGKPVDMAAIRSKNENVRAVGNMRVNARGDQIDSNNKVVAPAGQRVNRVYSRTTANPTAVAERKQPVDNTTPVSATPAIQPPVEQYSEPSTEELDMFNDLDADFIKPEVKTKKK